RRRLVLHGDRLVPRPSPCGESRGAQCRRAGIREERAPVRREPLAAHAAPPLSQLRQGGEAREHCRDQEPVRRVLPRQRRGDRTDGLMQDETCTSALDRFAKLALADWQGLPEGCLLADVEALWPPLDAPALALELGAARESATAHRL